MMGYPLIFMFECWPKMGFGSFLKNYFTLFKGDFSQMVYVAKEFDDQAEFFTKKMIKSPVWAITILKKVEKIATESLKEMRQIKDLHLKRMSNIQIIKLMKKVRETHEYHHGMGASLSWHADAEKERVTKGIMKVVDEKLKKSSLKKTLPEVFTVITTPTRESLMEKEEKSFLEIAQAINQKNKLKEIFIKSKLDGLIDKIKKADIKVYQKIIKHYNRYSPFTYQYKGPAYPLSDYIGRWQAFFKEGQSATKLLKNLERKRQQLKKEQQGLIKALKLSQYELNLVKLAQMLVFIKDYRKNALYNAMYYYEFIFKEIGRRLNLSINQIQTMQGWEIIEMLKTGKVNKDELNQRLVQAIDWWYKKSGKTYHKILVGKEAKEFLTKIIWQKVSKQLKELSGTCAYPGKVEGIVKVINVPEEMNKMKKGNIMVAHNTNPNLVPAMKKAAALVGAAGGLTCHTAIVAREMKVPCLVGALDCDRILKDGDRVEVDATNGTVRKINK